MLDPFRPSLYDPSTRFADGQAGERFRFMGNRQSHPQSRWRLCSPRKRVCAAVALMVLLGVGAPFSTTWGLLRVHWLLATSETVPMSEETSDPELAAPHAALHARRARTKAALPRRARWDREAGGRTPRGPPAPAAALRRQRPTTPAFASIAASLRTPLGQASSAWSVASASRFACASLVKMTQRLLGLVTRALNG